jgi:hypothetical protein
VPKLATYDRAALAALLKSQSQVISRRQALACGMSAESVRYQLRPGGPWQALLPGIYLTRDGACRWPERAAAGVLHAGRAIAVTGLVAATQYGIPCTLGDVVDVLVPPGCPRASSGFVRLHRTSRIPKTICDGAIPYAAPARAVADAIRQLADANDARALVAAAVQRGDVAIWQLATELKAGPPQGSARLRELLAEVADGTRSVAEADLRTLIRRAGLPGPLFNARLYIGHEFLASPDAWWPGHGVAAEVDSQEWHFAPAGWKRTTARHTRMTAQGILVLHFPPSQIHKEPRLVGQEIRSALAASRGPLPHVRTVPASKR